MDFNDIAGMAPESPDQKLREHIEAFVEEVFEHPHATDSTDMAIGGKKLVGDFSGLRTTTWDAPSILQPLSELDLDNFESAKDLQSFTESKYGFNLDDGDLKQVLRDALGPDLDSDNPNIDNAFSNLNNMIHGFGEGFAIVPLRGIKTSKGGVITDGISFESVESGFVYKPLAGALNMTIKSQPVPAHTVLKYPIEFDLSTAPNHVEHNTGELLRQLLQLYAGTRIGSPGTLIDLYGDYPEGHFSDPDQPPTPIKTFSTHDGRRFERLIDLLVEDKNSPIVPNSISRAFSHLTHSIDNWAKPHESITFSLIGLESIYKHYTDYGQASRDVQRYAGYLLSTIGRFNTAQEIRDFLEKDAYDVRNKWVHGQSAGLNTTKTEPVEDQRRVWDYLRASIVIFAWLESNTHFLDDNKLPLDDALIDENTRRELEQELSRFSLTDFLSTRL